MTATKQVTLWCDYPNGCITSVQIDTNHQVEAREQAQIQHGWSCNPRSDYCPEHREGGRMRRATNG